MIQRIQTLYLFSLVILSVVLLLLPSAEASFSNHQIPIYLLPISGELFHASVGQLAAMTINVISLLTTLICIFLYKKRVLQLKLSYALMIVWLAMTLILSFVPLAQEQEGMGLINTNFGSLLGIFGMLGAYMAARHIKKDIELLKSADRIR